MPIMLIFRNPAIAEAGGVVEECNISSDTWQGKLSAV